jgi:uncharacterized membrane protein
MNEILAVIIIGAISQILFFNNSRELLSDVNITNILNIGVSVFTIMTAYNFVIKDKKMTKLLTEALAVGVMTLVVGKISAYLVMQVLNMYNINKMYATEIILITTGILIHLLSEYSGINKWYISNGVAASS